MFVRDGCRYARDARRQVHPRRQRMDGGDVRQVTGVQQGGHVDGSAVLGAGHMLDQHVVRERGNLRQQTGIGHDGNADPPPDHISHMLILNNANPIAVAPRGAGVKHR